MLGRMLRKILMIVVYAFAAIGFLLVVGYFGVRYGIGFLAAAGLSPDAEPSAKAKFPPPLWNDHMWYPSHRLGGLFRCYYRSNYRDQSRNVSSSYGNRCWRGCRNKRDLGRYGLLD